MKSHLVLRVGTCYYRQAVPKDVRPYFLTKTGKPRTEFMVSLRTNERSVALKQHLEAANSINALIEEAKQKLAAGIPPTTAGAADMMMAAYDRWQEGQYALQQAVFQRDIEQEATEAAEDAALARDTDSKLLLLVLHKRPSR